MASKVVVPEAPDGAKVGLHVTPPSDLSDEAATPRSPTSPTWKRAAHLRYDKVDQKGDDGREQRDATAAASWRTFAAGLQAREERGRAFSAAMEAKVRAGVETAFDAHRQTFDEGTAAAGGTRLDDIVSSMSELQALSSSAAQSLQLKSLQLREKEKALKAAEQRAKEAEAQLAVEKQHARVAAAMHLVELDDERSAAKQASEAAAAAARRDEARQASAVKREAQGAASAVRRRVEVAVAALKREHAVAKSVLAVDRACFSVQLHRYRTSPSAHRTHTVAASGRARLLEIASGGAASPILRREPASTPARCGGAVEATTTTATSLPRERLVGMFEADQSPPPPPPPPPPILHIPPELPLTPRSPRSFTSSISSSTSPLPSPASPEAQSLIRTFEKAPMTSPRVRVLIVDEDEDEDEDEEKQVGEGNRLGKRGDEEVEAALTVEDSIGVTMTKAIDTTAIESRFLAKLAERSRDIYASSTPTPVDVPTTA